MTQGGLKTTGPFLVIGGRGRTLQNGLGFRVSGLGQCFSQVNSSRMGNGLYRK